ncbi:hypothetical protein Trydic_g16138 [Trypoxylus dichotomus]
MGHGTTHPHRTPCESTKPLFAASTPCTSQNNVARAESPIRWRRAGGVPRQAEQEFLRENLRQRENLALTTVITQKIWRETKHRIVKEEARGPGQRLQAQKRMSRSSHQVPSRKTLENTKQKFVLSAVSIRLILVARCWRFTKALASSNAIEYPVIDTNWASNHVLSCLTTAFA